MIEISQEAIDEAKARIYSHIEISITRSSREWSLWDARVYIETTALQRIGILNDDEVIEIYAALEEARAQSFVHQPHMDRVP